MSDSSSLLFKVMEETLTAEFIKGRVYTPPPTTGWYSLPDTLLAAVSYFGELEFEDRKVQLKPGDAYCVPAGVYHCRNLTGDKPGVSRWSYTRFTVFNGIDIFNFLRPPTVIHGEAAARIGRANASLVELTAGGNPSAKDLVRKKKLLFGLLDATIEGAEEKPLSGRAFSEAQRLAPALAHLSRNLSEPGIIEGMAGRCGLSRPRFDVVFKSVFGVSPGRYVLDLRMRNAQRLLISTMMPVGEIAALSGFSEIFHFSKIFKQKCGLSPKAYRDQTSTL